MKNASLVDLVKKLPELNDLKIDIECIDVKGIVKMLPYTYNLSKLSIGSERSNVQIGIVDLSINSGNCQEQRKFCQVIYRK